MSKRFLVAGVALLAAAPLAAQGRNCNVSGPATSKCEVKLTTEVQVPDLMRLDLSRGTLELGDPGISDFEAGHKDGAMPVRVTVKSNRQYKVTIQADEPSFGYSGPHAGTTKPAADLLWSTTSGSFDVTRHVGTASDLGGDNSATNGRDADVYFRTKYSFANDKPGTYSLAVNFTIAAK